MRDVVTGEVACRGLRGRIESVRAEPPTPEEYRLRLEDELAVSLAWLRRCTWD